MSVLAPQRCCGLNAAIYVAQIEDERLEPIIQDGSYLQATREVLSRYNGLWFNDESFVVSRKRDREHAMNDPFTLCRSKAV